MEIIKAIFRRDLIDRGSYRVTFLFDTLSILANAVTFYFIQKLILPNASGPLAHYEGNYFSFVLIGLTFSGFQTIALNSFTNAIRHEQESGTLEAILLSPSGLHPFFYATLLWNLLSLTLRITLYFLIGICLGAFSVEKINVLSLFISLLLTLSSLSGFGLLSAAFVMVFKRGDPIHFLINGLSRFLSGVYFPVTLLPFWLQFIGGLLPLTYALEAIRRSVLNGDSIHSIWGLLTTLFVFSCFSIPLGAFLFYKALRKTQKDGTLLFY